MMAAACLILLCAGFTMLALSQARHRRRLFGQAPGPTAMPYLKAAGWLALAFSAVPALAASHGPLGIVLWFGLATVAALLVALAFSQSARRRR